MKYKFYEVSSIVTTIQTRLVRAKSKDEALEIIDSSPDPWRGKDEIMDSHTKVRIVKDNNEVYGRYVLTDEGDVLFTKL